MKKVTALIAAFMMITAVGCGRTVGNTGGSPQLPASNTAPAETGTGTAGTSGSVSTIAPSDVMITAPAADYVVNEDGAVEFGKPISQQEDSVLMEAAERLYAAACTTQWRYSVGCPYEVDRSQTVQNGLGWDFYLVIEDGINSLADVRADYHKIFSEGYADAITETFMESGGRVYCLCGERGANIFYQRSTVASIKSKSDSEVTFSVDSSYTDDGFGRGEYTANDDFTAVIDSDGVWRVKEFRLPF